MFSMFTECSNGLNGNDNNSTVHSYVNVIFKHRPVYLSLTSDRLILVFICFLYNSYLTIINLVILYCNVVLMLWDSWSLNE